MADEITRNYILRPPYYGKSTFADRVAVKNLCGPTCCYDSVRKLWGTKCEDALQDLIKSRKWQPFGIEYEWNPRLVRAAREHRQQLETRWVADQEAQAQDAQRQIEASHAKSPASWFTAKSTPNPKRVKTAPASTPAPKVVATKAAAPIASTKHGVLPTPNEVMECADLGFSADSIAFSDTLNELGPRGTLSSEGRILRWCVSLRSGAREHLFINSVDEDDFFHNLEVDPGPYGVEAYFDAERLAKLTRLASVKFADRLALRCQGLELLPLG